MLQSRLVILDMHNYLMSETCKAYATDIIELPYSVSCEFELGEILAKYKICCHITIKVCKDGYLILTFAE